MQNSNWAADAIKFSEDILEKPINDKLKKYFCINNIFTTNSIFKSNVQQFWMYIKNKTLQVHYCLCGHSASGNNVTAAFNRWVTVVHGFTHSALINHFSLLTSVFEKQLNFMQSLPFAFFLLFRCPHQSNRMHQTWPDVVKGHDRNIRQTSAAWQTKQPNL